MELLGYNEEDENDSKHKKGKKILLFSIIGCTILVVILLLLIAYIINLDSKKLKLYIDEKQTKISSTLFKYDNKGNIEYISIKELAEMLGYSYLNGEYGSYTEDKNSCYIQNDNEIISFVADTNVIKKYINESSIKLDSEKENSTKSEDSKKEKNKVSTEIFQIGNQVKLYDDILYVSWDDASTSFDSYITRDEMKIKVYTLQALANSYNKKAIELGYDKISTNFKNVRALTNDMLIVEKDKQYAVLDMSKNYEVIVGKKYDELEYIQNTQEFIVTANGNVGLLSSKGETKITPNTQYKSIELLDVRKDLYIVEQSGKYGVLNGTGKAIVPADFDRIGIEIDTAMGLSNTKLLFENLIPVKKDEKWGFYDVKGNYVLKANYDNIGYKKQDDDDASVKDTVIIPKEIGVEGIIISLGESYYGIADSNGRIIIPCSYSKIYASSNLGETEYFYEMGENKDLLENLLRQSSYINTNNSMGSEENVNNVETPSTAQ